jgi:hypothetical protein
MFLLSGTTRCSSVLMSLDTVTSPECPSSCFWRIIFEIGLEGLKCVPFGLLLMPCLLFSVYLA